MVFANHEELSKMIKNQGDKPLNIDYITKVVEKDALMNDKNRILFEKPDLAALRKQHTVVDMHFHTLHSDGQNNAREIAEKCRRLGIGVAVTDHNQITGALEISKDNRILSIPGIEITSLEGTHVLVYFYQTKSLKAFYAEVVKPHMGSNVMSSISLPMEQIIKKARRFKSVIIFPHPYCAAYTGICNFHFPEERLQQLWHLVDGIEVINSENLKKWNLKCAVLGFNLGKAITGGSDGHKLYQLGKVVTYADCKNSRRAFLDAIRKKQTKVVGKEIAILRKMTSNGYKLKSNIKNYPDFMEKNIRYSYTVINSKSKQLKENVKRSINGKIKKAGWL